MLKRAESRKPESLESKHQIPEDFLTEDNRYYPDWQKTQEIAKVSKLKQKVDKQPQKLNCQNSSSPPI